MENHKIVWLEDEVHHQIHIEAAKNKMRIGKFTNQILKEFLERQKQ